MDNWLGKWVKLNPDKVGAFVDKYGYATLHHSYLLSRPDVKWEVMSQEGNSLSIRPDGLDAQVVIESEYLVEVAHG